MPGKLSHIPLAEWNPITLLDENVEIGPVREAIKAHPELWNEYRLRTIGEGPHAGCDDIWVRCLSWGVMSHDPARFNIPHESSWYPAADVPEIKQAALDVLARFHECTLGGVLITRIPAYHQVLPHIDHGWHARAHTKVALQIHAHPAQKFCFAKKNLTTYPGDVFAFDNSFAHWVSNPTPEERITMICCIRDPKEVQPCRGV